MQINSLSFQGILFEVATSQLYNFSSSNFSSLIPAAALGPLAHPRHRALVPIAAFHCIWKVATWKILTWKVTLGNRLWENTLRGKKIK